VALRRPVRFISLGACEACKVGRLGGAPTDSPFGIGRLSERAGVDLLALRYVAHPEASARVLAGGAGPRPRRPVPRRGRVARCPNRPSRRAHLRLPHVEPFPRVDSVPALAFGGRRSRSRWTAPTIVGARCGVAALLAQRAVHPHDFIHLGRGPQASTMRGSLGSTCGPCRC
jgi:hypothetical protein